MPLLENTVWNAWLFGISIVLSFVGSNACFASQMSLEEGIAIALRRSPAVGIAQESVRRADAELVGAAASGSPKLILDASYRQSDREPVIDFQDSEISLGSRSSRLLELNISQPLDFSGALRTERLAAGSLKASSQYDLQRQIQDTILDVTSSFYNVHRAKSYLRVQEENLSLLQAVEKDSEAGLTAGVVSNFDVLRAKTELANARKGLLEAQNGLRLSEAAFNNSIGVPLDNPVDLQYVPTPVYAYPDTEACTKAALEFRPEIGSAMARIRSLESKAESARLRNRPKFDLRLGFMYNFDPNAFIPKAGSLNLLLYTTIPFYDGGTGRSDVERAQIDLRKARIERDRIAREISLEVRQASLNLAESRERTTAARKLVETTRESGRLAEISYKGGVVTQLDVLTAQAGLTGAKTALVNSEYDYEEALARLARAVGGREHLEKVLEIPQKVDN